jgi:hypothetical protein
MTREEAMEEVRRRRVTDPNGSWIATARGREWAVVRLGKPPGAKRTRNAPPTRPPGVAKRRG